MIHYPFEGKSGPEYLKVEHITNLQLSKEPTSPHPNTSKRKGDREEGDQDTKRSIKSRLSIKKNAKAYLGS